MATTQLAPFPRFRALDQNGNALPGAKLYTYAAGTSTPLATYDAQDGLSANANPVVCDSEGYADVWLAQNTAYKFTLKDSSDVQQWEVDEITGLGATGSSGNDLDIAGDTGSGTVTLGTDTFTVEGTANQMETTFATDTITMAFTNDVTMPNDLTVTADLIVDTSTLKVDSTNNRVGIGTATPSNTLHLLDGSGSGATYSSGEQIVIDSDGNADLVLASSATGYGRIYFGNSGDTYAFDFAFNHTDTKLTWDFGETLVLTSTTSQLKLETSLYVDNGNSAASASSGADDLVVESSGDGGLSILNPAANNGRIGFTSNSVTDEAYIDVDHNTATLLISGTTTLHAKITADDIDLESTNGDTILDVNDGNGVNIFPGSADGTSNILKIYGYKSGGTLEALEISVGADTDQRADFAGCAAGYAFDNKIYTPQNGGGGNLGGLFCSTHSSSIYFQQNGGIYLNANAEYVIVGGSNEFRVGNSANVWTPGSLSVVANTGGTSLDVSTQGSAHTHTCGRYGSDSVSGDYYNLKIRCENATPVFVDVANFIASCDGSYNGYFSWETSHSTDAEGVTDLRMRLNTDGKLSLYTDGDTQTSTPTALEVYNLCSAGVGQNNIGAYILIGARNSNAGSEDWAAGGAIGGILTDVTDTTEDGKLDFQAMVNGSLTSICEVDGSGINLITGKTIEVNGTQVITSQQTALTGTLTGITHTAPGTPDYAIANLTNSSPYGFVSQDEGNTVLSVIANLQTRVDELETKLQAHGLIA